MVGSLRSGLAALFSLPDGYEVVLGNGGHHLLLGRRHLRPHRAEEPAPELRRVLLQVRHRRRRRPPPGRARDHRLRGGHPPEAVARDDVDLYALTHNETSTGVMMEIARPARRRAGPGGRRRHLGGRAASGSTPPSSTPTTSPPRSASAPTAGCGWRSSPPPPRSGSPPSAPGRWVPASMDLTIALDNSRLDQTYNTPALATLFLFDNQVHWFNDNGGLEFSAGRCDRSAEILYAWAEASDFATPFVAKAEERSHVIGTIDFDDVDRRRHGGQGPAGQRHRRHRALPQARPQPAPHRHVPRHRPRRRRRPVRLHHPRGRRPLPVGHPSAGAWTAAGRCRRVSRPRCPGPSACRP